MSDLLPGYAVIFVARQGLPPEAAAFVIHTPSGESAPPDHGAIVVYDVGNHSGEELKAEIARQIILKRPGHRSAH